MKQILVEKAIKKSSKKNSGAGSATRKTNNLTVNQFTPTQAASLQSLYIARLAQHDAFNTLNPPPIHLLGVKGGVGTTTLYRMANMPKLLLDYTIYDSAHQYVFQLPRIILVSNLTYLSIQHLQAILQQCTSHQSFGETSFRPEIVGVAVVDNTNIRKTSAAKRYLNYVTSGIPHVWEFSFIPMLQDITVDVETVLPEKFHIQINEMKSLVLNDSKRKEIK